MLLEILKHTRDSKIISSILQLVQDDLEREDQSDAVLHHPVSQRVLSRLIKLEAETIKAEEATKTFPPFASELLNLFQSQIPKLLSTRAVFLLVALCESPATTNEAKVCVLKHH